MSIAEIKQQLISRIIYSKKLLDFVRKVEQKSVTFEEANRVCADILGKKSPRPIEVILLFKPLLKEQLKTYQKMVNICDGKNNAIAIANLDLYLEDQIYTNKEVIQTFGAISKESLKWANILTEEQECFESFRKILKPHLPAPYQFLKKYFSFMLHNSTYNKFDRHKNQKVNYVINLNFNEDLCYELATQYAVKSANGLINKKLHLLSNDEHKENLVIIARALSAIVSSKNILVKEYVEKVKVNLTVNVEWISLLIKKTFELHEELTKIKNNLIIVYKELVDLADESERKLNLLEHIKVIQPKVEKYAVLCTKQKEAWQTYIQHAPKINDEELEIIANKVSISEKILARYFDDLTKEVERAALGDKIPTGDEISKFGIFCEKKLGEIKKIANQHAQFILEHQTLSQDFLNQKAMQEVLQIKEEEQTQYFLNQKLIQETQQAKEEKQKYITEKQYCTFLWNAKVEEQRQTKKQATLHAKSKGTQSVDPLELEEKEKKDKLEILRVAESLKHLSMHYIQLMKSIYRREKGIFYDQVCCLITNQLGGKILEHGGGSSHKTIVLNNFSTYFISSNQLPMTIKSGMYKPHGKARQSGELCGFNLELIEDALFKGRITLEVLDLLEQMKLNDSVSKLCI